MLILLLLLYAIPVYLVFFRLKWLPLNKRWWTVILAPPIAGGVFFWFAMGRYTPMTLDAYVQAPVVQVAPQVDGKVEQVLAAENQTISAGSPLFKIEVGAFQERVDQARAQFISAQEQSVSLLASLAASEHALHTSEAQLVTAQRNIDASKAAAAAALEAVSDAKAQSQLAETQFQRAQSLLPHKAISQADFDQAKSKVDSAAAHLRAAKQQEAHAQAAVAGAESQAVGAAVAVLQSKAKLIQQEVLIYPLKTLDAGIQSHESKIAAPDKSDAKSKNVLNGDATDLLVRDWRLEIEWMEKLKDRIGGIQDFLGQELPGERTARETLNLSERDLRNTNVVSSTGGVITGMHVAQGTFVKRGIPVLGIIDTSHWWLIANYPENWLVKIKPGDKALVSLRNYPGSMRKATVASVSRGVVQGQGVPDGLLPDTASRRVRQSDTPLDEQRFQVLFDLTDDKPDEPLRVGQTGRAVIFASGGFPVMNTIFTVIAYVSSLMDFFFPRPSSLLVFAVIGGVGFVVWKWRKRPPAPA